MTMEAAPAIKTLGLDLGTSSIGWTLIESDPTPKRIIDMGVRIFPEGMDRSRGEKSLNEDRRIARSLRRQTYRRARRKTRLLQRLIEAKLLPKSAEQQAALWLLNPYELRSRALTEKLTPFQLGRALYHLGQRRGYLSNRKTGNDKEDGAVAEGITAIDTAMKEGGFATLGAYLNSLDQSLRQRYQQKESADGKKTESTTPHHRVRGYYTARRMYLDEFDAIWQAQTELGAKLPSLAQRKNIWHAIFDQRPLKIQKHLIGHCQFEPDRKRAMAATLAAQEFRLLQNLNHLRVSHHGEPERYLTDTERNTLYQKLSTQQKLSWAKIRELLNFLEDAEFNLQRVRGNDLQGNQTAALASGALGKAAWRKLGEKRQEQLVTELLTIEDEDTLKRRLLSHWALPVETINKLLRNSRKFPKGYLHLSHKAIRNLLPHLRRCYQELHAEEIEKLRQADRNIPDGHQGISYADAMILAGYHHSHKNWDKTAALLPFPGQTGHRQQRQLLSQVAVHELRNPMVERAIYQLRKVVNAIIREYGMPDIIRLEMSRDLKMTRKNREDYQKKQKENEAANRNAEKKLQEYGIEPSYTDLIKYRLWDECGRVCPYTGQSISMDALFGNNPRFEIEHIIPYSRCLDNSYRNKTLCDVDENRRKGNLIPFEYYNGKPEYEGIKQRIKKLPPNKRKRFWWEEIDTDGFVSQQMNETRYIARKAREYLEQLPARVEPVNSGQLTAILRRAWNLNGLLSENGEKSRLDHRHHAVDALVVALTTASEIHKINRYASFRTDAQLRFRDYPEPMPDIRPQAAAMVDQIVVSHKAQRKIKGPLHDETLYGLTPEDEQGQRHSVIRKPLSELNKRKQLEAIRDEKIRELALRRLDECDGNFKQAFQNPEEPFGMITKQGHFRPIRRVRLIGARSVERIGRSPRHVWTRSNHHIAIFEVTDKKGRIKWISEPVSMLEAARRLRKKEEIIHISRTDGGRFIMALHRNDIVKLENKGKTLICRVVKFDQRGRFTFRQHIDADKEDMKRAIAGRLVEPLRAMDMKKLDVSLLGKISSDE